MKGDRVGFYSMLKRRGKIAIATSPPPHQNLHLHLRSKKAKSAEAQLRTFLDVIF
jgi:hypothetical protein